MNEAALPQPVFSRVQLSRFGLPLGTISSAGGTSSHRGALDAPTVVADHSNTDKDTVAKRAALATRRSQDNFH